MNGDAFYCERPSQNYKFIVAKSLPCIHVLYTSVTKNIITDDPTAFCPKIHNENSQWSKFVIPTAISLSTGHNPSYRL